jgi:hypothetical protein
MSKQLKTLLGTLTVLVVTAAVVLLVDVAVSLNVVGGVWSG